MPVSMDKITQVYVGKSVKDMEFEVKARCEAGYEMIRKP